MLSCTRVRAWSHKMLSCLGGNLWLGGSHGMRRIRGLHACVRFSAHTQKLCGVNHILNVGEDVEPWRIRIDCKLS